MEVLSKAYNGLRGLVRRLTNSPTAEEPLPPKKENREAWYAEWDDNYMDDWLDNYLSKAVLRKIADSYYQNQFEQIINGATKLSAESYPFLRDVYSACCDALGMYNQPEAYITGKMMGINALSLEVAGRQVILISPTVATCLSPSEQMFLLGHEISHHQQGNLVCHTVNGLIDDFSKASEIIGPLVLDAIEVPLKRWCRQSEFNADRAGLICCGSLETAYLLFQRLGMNRNPKAFDRLQELSSPYPLLQTRWEMLQQYERNFKKY